MGGGGAGVRVIGLTPQTLEHSLLFLRVAAMLLQDSENEALQNLLDQLDSAIAQFEVCIKIMS